MKCQAPKRASADTVNGESQTIEWLIVNGGTVSPTLPAHSMQLTKEVHWTCVPTPIPAICWNGNKSCRAVHFMNQPKNEQVARFEKPSEGSLQHSYAPR